MTTLQERATQLFDKTNEVLERAISERTDREAQVSTAISNMQGSQAIYRLTRNQNGAITSGNLDFWAKNGAFPMVFSIHRVITPGIAWASRDAEEQEILTGIGVGGGIFAHNINVIKMDWSGCNVPVPFASTAANFTFFQRIHHSGGITHACYAKILEGNIGSTALSGVSMLSGATTGWKLCGYSTKAAPARYHIGHPYVSTGSGSVLMIAPAIVAGVIDLSNPKNWGFFQYMNQSEAV